MTASEVWNRFGAVEQSPRRFFWLTFGFVFVAIGVIALFIPVLPTMPFLIAAGACFSKGSQRYHAWLLRQPFVGESVLRWEKHRAISRQDKRAALIGMAGGLVLVLFVFSVPLWARVSAVVFIAASALFVATRPEA